MTKEIWLNLPVKDIAKSKAFFTKLGFSFNEEHASPVNACMIVGEKKAVVMLFEEATFKSITRSELADAKQSAEILISFDAETREEVDEIAKKAADAGANLFGPPAETDGWMYGCAFADLDGHRWNALYMDMSKMGG